MRQKGETGTEKNMAITFRTTVKKYEKRLAVEKRLNNVWQGISWEEYFERAKAVGLGLYILGVRKRDCVSLLSQNRLEWIIADIGIICIGAVTMPFLPCATSLNGSLGTSAA